MCTGRTDPTWVPHLHAASDLPLTDLNLLGIFPLLLFVSCLLEHLRALKNQTTTFPIMKPTNNLSIVILNQFSNKFSNVIFESSLIVCFHNIKPVPP